MPAGILAGLICAGRTFLQFLGFGDQCHDGLSERSLGGFRFFVYE